MATDGARSRVGKMGGAKSRAEALEMLRRREPTRKMAVSMKTDIATERRVREGAETKSKGSRVNMAGGKRMT